MGKVDWSTALGKISAASGTAGQVSPEPISKAILTIIGAGAGVAQGLRNNAKANKAAAAAMKKPPGQGLPIAWIIAGAGVLLLLLFKRK